ncbi:stalk domain-containing protein [Brevibacillus porteri]|uniref:stalk domain-containing protein n=1 Tax=Brevibacillus porteri TaxID=2126350 RepID=UPI003D191569
MIVNDQVVKTKAEPFIYNGNVYAPVATVANALGIKQEWDNKTPAVRFSGTGGSTIPDAIVQQAKDTLPLPCDPSDVKGSLYYCAPQKEVVSKGYVNLTGMSDQEFLVMYRYHTIEGLPWEAYLTLFRQSNGKVVPINTSKVFDGSK